MGVPLLLFHNQGRGRPIGSGGDDPAPAPPGPVPFYLGFSDPEVPVVADFSWINQDGATAVDDSDGIYLSRVGQAGVHVNALVRTAPSTPYTITALIGRNAISQDYQTHGLCFRQSSDGKLAAIQYTFFTNKRLRVGKFDSPTAYSANYVAFVVWDAPLTFFRIEDDGTDRICSISRDGINFIEVHSVGRTDFLTADQVGFFIDPENATYACGLKLYHWKEE